MHNLRFLESADNTRGVLARMHKGAVLPDGVARDVAIFLQQGRLFYESASGSPLEIRPLLIAYGTIAYARGLVCAYRGICATDLKGSHGLSDRSQKAGSRLVETRVKTKGDGGFQAFNDVVAELVRLSYFEMATPAYIKFVGAPSKDLGTVDLSLKDILARIPQLDEEYEGTFAEPALSLPITSLRKETATFWELRIDERRLCTDLPSVVDLIVKLRERFPILHKWRLASAQRAWNRTILIFHNVAPPLDEINALEQDGDDLFVCPTAFTPTDPSLHLNVDSLLTPPAGGLGQGAVLLTPVSGSHICEYSLHYMGIYLLSSLVRYRPRTWVHAITRSETPTEPADDQALALVEAFMAHHMLAIRGLIQEVFLPIG